MTHTATALLLLGAAAAASGSTITTTPTVSSNETPRESAMAIAERPNVKMVLAAIQDEIESSLQIRIQESISEALQTATVADAIAMNADYSRD